MRRAIQLLLAAAILTAAVPFAGAQTTAPFLIKVQQGTNLQVIGDGGTLALPADGLGLASDGTITVSYTGTGSAVYANITQIMLSGSTDFAVTSMPDLSAGALNLTPQNTTFVVRIRYNPTTSKLATGKVTFSYVTETNARGTFSVNLTGTAPEFVATYAVQPNGNAVQLNNGDNVEFPMTGFTETSSILVTLTNRGSGTGTVNGVTYTGTNRIGLAQVPLMPATVDAGKDMKFLARFAPDDFPGVYGAVTVSFPGKTLGFKLEGWGLGAWFEYAVVTDKGAKTVEPGGSIKLPDATVGGDKTTVTVKVVNTGNDSGRIANLSVSGTGFSLIESPFMPYTLDPDGSFTFKIQFAPAQPGKTAGRLRVGADNFELEGNALGANLTYSYAATSGNITLSSGGTVVLPAAAVGETSTVKFTVTNDGTAPQDVVSISASGPAAGVFAVSGLPSLPRKLNPTDSVTFTVTFAPTTTGNSAGTLKVDTQSFALSGVGNPPAALPAYSFQGASGTVDAAQQPALGLSLNSAYGLAVNGTLNLTFTSDVFANDPAVQFSSGGRSIAFTIPAGSKQAVFPNGATQVRVQTGTVAGTITLSPTFATAQGGIDLTPATPSTVALTVPQSAPRVLNAIVSSKSGANLTLLVTGYATGRSITQMDFQFNAVSGENLGNGKVSIPVESTFNAWYQGAASTAYGSQFTATVPFTLSGEIKDTKNIPDLVSTLQSVSVTLTNRQGVSTAVNVTLK